MSHKISWVGRPIERPNAFGKPEITRVVRIEGTSDVLTYVWNAPAGAYAQTPDGPLGPRALEIFGLPSHEQVELWARESPAPKAPN